MKYLLEALLISFSWGSLNVANKYVLQYLDSSTVFVLNGIVYFLLLIGFWFYNKKVIDHDIKNITSFQSFCIIISSSLFLFFPSVLYYYYLKRTKSSIFSAIAYSSPVFTLILAYLFLNERIKATSILGILLITFGICLISYEE